MISKFGGGLDHCKQPQKEIFSLIYLLGLKNVSPGFKWEVVLPSLFVPRIGLTWGVRYSTVAEFGLNFWLENFQRTECISCWVQYECVCWPCITPDTCQEWTLFPAHWLHVSGSTQKEGCSTFHVNRREISRPWLTYLLALWHFPMWRSWEQVNKYYIRSHQRYGNLV